MSEQHLDKMDTQGMSGGLIPKGSSRMLRGNNYPIDPVTGEVIYPVMMVEPKRLLEGNFIKEIKILLNEVLDEREGKFNYTSYFDTKQYTHRVGEEEPPYEP